MSSVCIDIKSPLRYWSLAESSLPSSLLHPDGELLHAFSFPNASLCSDLLLNEELQEWVGVAVAVADADMSYVKAIIENTDSVCCKLLVTPGVESGIFANYPNLNWLQVVWSESPPTVLLEVQTDGVLWYSKQPSGGASPKLSAVVLEDIPYLIEESGENMTLQLERGSICEL